MCNPEKFQVLHIYSESVTKVFLELTSKENLREWVRRNINNHANIKYIQEKDHLYDDIEYRLDELSILFEEVTDTKVNVNFNYMTYKFPYAVIHLNNPDEVRITDWYYFEY